MDDPSPLVPFGAALAGAALGGLASTLGARWLERQKERIRIYRGLLPVVREAKTGLPAGLDRPDLMETLYRSAVVTGRRDAKLVDKVQAAWVDPGFSSIGTDDEGNWLPHPDRPKAAERFDAAVEALDTHLRKKLRRRI